MTALTRRKVLKLGASTPFVAGMASQSFAMPQDTLATLAERSGILFGSAVAREVLSDSGYRRLYLEETRSVTTDYALKFDALRPGESEYRFDGADSLIDFAAKSALKVRGHTLIWNENAPDWLKAKSKPEKARVFEDHIDTVARRYAGKLHTWDVVNEPFWPGHRLPGGFRQGPWYDAFGPDYVRRAFVRVAAIDKSARLAINEAHTERSDALGQANRAGLLKLIDDLQHSGTPLHAIGLQGHLQPQFPSDDDGFVAFLHQIAARKLEIHITELDVDDSSYSFDLVERDKAVAARTYAFLSKILTVPAVNTVCTWELSDLYSWYRDPDLMRKTGARRMARPLPFDDRMERKSMWMAIASALRERKIS